MAVFRDQTSFKKCENRFFEFLKLLGRHKKILEKIEIQIKLNNKMRQRCLTKFAHINDLMYQGTM